MECDGLRAPRAAGGTGGALRGDDSRNGEAYVPVRFRTSGCLASIVASVVLTVVLNLMLRACAG